MKSPWFLLNMFLMNLKHNSSKNITYYRQTEHCKYKKRCIYKKQCTEQDPLTLTPIILEGDEPALEIVKHLEAAIRIPNILNIALMGSYGSGKSSIIRTVADRASKKQSLLKISLAALSALPDNCTKTEQDKFQLHQKIEYSILQQLIYKDTTKTPRSRFSTIKHLSPKRSTGITAIIILAAVCLGFIFELEWLTVPSVKKHLMVGELSKLILDSIAILVVLISLFIFLMSVVKSSSGIRLNRIKIANAEIESKLPDQQTSVFNKHLDEIIYFFQATKYKIVVFEDLDRFNDPELFLKLREINLILNASTSINGPIKFIYAIRDGLFKEHLDRIKFFDKIITVIPHIDTSNSSEKLKDLLKANPTVDITDEDCYGIGAFINDMRLMKNIVSELKQYISILHKKTNQEENRKLLGLITYKNFHPTDFELIYNNKGTLFSIFERESKELYHQEYVNYLNSLKYAAKEKIKQLNENSIELIKQLRKEYLSHYTTSSSHEYVIKGKTYSEEDIASNDELFESVENGKLSYKTKTYSTISDFSVSFADIEVQVNEIPYKTRYKEYLLTDDIEKQHKTLNQLNERVKDAKRLKTGEIYSRHKIPSLQAKLEDNKLLSFLISSNMIDDSYYQYISHFYPGRITKNDNNFIKNVLGQQQLDYSYPLDKPEEVVRHLLISKHFDQNILNFDIINDLYQSTLQQDLFKQCVNHIQSGNNYTFIREYYTSRVYNREILGSILSGWGSFTRLFDKSWSSDKKNEYVEILLLHYSASNAYIIPPPLTETLNNSFDLFAEQTDIIEANSIDTFCKKFGVKFSIIDPQKDQLFDIVVNANHYALNEVNIKHLIRSEGLSEEEYSKAAYTTILKLEHKIVKSYIADNIVNCIKVFPRTSTDESEEALVSIMNTPNISFDNIKGYLTRQKNKISSLQQIESSTLEEELIVHDLVTPSWVLISNLYKEYKFIDGYSVDFITRNISYLGKCSEGEVGKQLLNEMFCHLLGENMNFDTVTIAQLCESFDLSFTKKDLSNLKEIHISMLIHKDKIQYNEHFHNLISEHFPKLLPVFIVRHINLYIANINSFVIGSSTIVQLLQSTQINKARKTTILNKLSPNLLYADNNVASEVCRQVAHIGLKNLTIDFGNLVHIINKSTDKENKLKCVIEILKAYPFTQEHTTQLLSALGGQYARTPQRKQAKWPLNEHSKHIANYIVENAYEHIKSNPREEIDCIRVYTKKPQ